MDTTLETERLTLRRFTGGDLDALVELDGDPGVMRYLSGGKPTPRAEMRDKVIPYVLDIYERFPGFGAYIALDRQSGDFLGWCSLRPSLGDIEGHELGYRLRRAAWGRGLATEGMTALMARAFEEQNVERVFAITMSVNAASRAVMRKIGLRYVRTFHEVFEDPIPGTEEGEVEYAVTRAQYGAGR